MRKMDSASARIFVAIIEEGSIGRAAVREHIVASAVSKRLSDLEAMLQVSLVERSRTGVVPTPAGEALLHHARMVLRAIDRMHDEMTEYVAGVRGHIRVRVSSSSLSAGLPVDLQSFVQTHRRVKIDLEELETPAIVRDIVESRADVGIAPTIFRNESLDWFAYKKYDLVSTVPRNHPLASLSEVSYLQTLEYDQVEQNRVSALSQLLDEHAHQAGVVKRTRIRVRGFEAVCSMVGCGMGIGIVPSFLSTHADLYGLKMIPLTDAWAHPLICVLVRDFETLPSAAKAFVAHLRRAAVKGLDQHLSTKR